MEAQSKTCENCGAAGSRLFHWNNRRVCIQCRVDLERAAKEHATQAPADTASQSPSAVAEPEFQPATSDAPTQDDSAHENFSDLAAAALGAAGDRTARPIAAVKPKYKKLKIVLAIVWLASLAFMLWAFYHAYQRMQGGRPDSDASTPTPATFPAATLPSSHK